MKLVHFHQIGQLMPTTLDNSFILPDNVLKFKTVGIESRVRTSQAQDCRASYGREDENSHKHKKWLTHTLLCNHPIQAVPFL